MVDKMIKFIACDNTLSHGSRAICVVRQHRRDAIYRPDKKTMAPDCRDGPEAGAENSHRGKLGHLYYRSLSEL